MPAAISTITFIDSLGVNTHLDFAAYGYENIATVESAIRYLGLVNLRDSAETASDATLWQQVAQATGAKFDDYIAETSPAGMATDLGYVAQLAGEGILNYLEGGNEEDDAYPASLGNTLTITAQFQHQVFALGQQLGLPVINMSFGSGWTAANNWQGDYGAVGDLSVVSNYANAHSYPNPGQLPGDTISRMNGLANLAAASRPVITTEIGWDENAGFTQAQVADYVLDAALDGIKYGAVKTYFYALFNDGAGNFGLMNSDGTPKPAGVALHNLTTLLADGGTSFTPGALSYTLSTSDDTVLMEKSDGSFWLGVWNESAGAHTDTLTLGSAAAQIVVFDPITGTTAVQTVSGTSSITFTVPDHPVIVEIKGGTGTGGTGSPPAPPAPDPVVSAPAAETVAAGAVVAITKVSIADPWAATAPGNLALNVSTTGGTVAMKDASGNAVSGSGTGSISVSGPLAQLNAELATLAYTAGTANAAVTVDVWDQGGVEATKLIGVTVTAPIVVAPTPDPVVTVPAAETVTARTTTAVAGVSISDPWAASNPGSLDLTVTTSSGTIAMPDASGKPVAGSGTAAIEVSGTVAQLNAELAKLTYTAGTASGSVTVDVWDQAGVEAVKSFAVTVKPPVITIPASAASVTETVSGAQIVATSGNHMIFIGGTGDTLTATGGTETVQANLGGNTITTGAGNDTIRFGGSHNVINAGAGNNVLVDSGASNTIVLPAGGHGYDDIQGNVLNNGDRFDLRSMLAATSWKGGSASLAPFVKLTTSGSSAVISVDPTGALTGATYAVGKLEGSGALSLSTLLAHSIT